MWILTNSKDLTIACVSDLSENYWGSDCFRACLLPVCCIPLATLSLSVALAEPSANYANAVAMWPCSWPRPSRPSPTATVQPLTSNSMRAIGKPLRNLPANLHIHRLSTREEWSPWARWPKGYSFWVLFLITHITHISNYLNKISCILLYDSVRLK